MTNPDLLTPQGVASLRASLQLSRSTFSRFLGVNESTVRRWESGTSSPYGLPRVCLHALILARDNTTPEQVAKIVNDSEANLGRSLCHLLNAAYFVQKEPER